MSLQYLGGVGRTFCKGWISLISSLKCPRPTTDVVDHELNSLPSAAVFLFPLLDTTFMFYVQHNCVNYIIYWPLSGKPCKLLNNNNNNIMLQAALYVYKGITVKLNH